MKIISKNARPPSQFSLRLGGKIGTQQIRSLLPFSLIKNIEVNAYSCGL